ncbi:T9SS type A sorting domain-containing protein [bacterium]|nr:T9SS type A sorting domain-containing protein [bacterium]
MKKSVYLLLFLISNLGLSAQSFQFDTALVLHLPLDSAIDDATSNHTVTSNGHSWTTDRFGRTAKAVSLDGSSDYLTAESFGDNMPRDEFTVTFWAKAYVTRSMNMCMLMPNDESNRFAVSYFYKSSGISYHYFEFGSISDNRLVLNNVDYDSAWHLITCTSSESSGIMSMYLDDQLILSGNIAETFSSNTKDLRVGGGKDNNFFGVIDDFRVYDFALDSFQVKEIYNANLTSSLEDFETITWSAYPNPATDFVNISISRDYNFADFTVNIYNAMGQVVYSAPMTSFNSQINLGLIKSKGLYNIELIDPKNRIRATKKVILN